MDDATHILSMLSHVYGAQSASSTIPSPIANNVSLSRVSPSHRSAFEHLLVATRNVGHELVSALASKLALERVLDQLPCGLILVTADLEVLSANKPARELAESSNGFTIVKRRLVCMDGRSHQKLEQRIQYLHSKPQDESNSTVMRVVRANDALDLQLRIVSFGAVHPMQNPTDIPAYCIWIFDPTAYKTIDSYLLRELHGLTATEATVAAALFRGLSIEEVAEKFGVTGNTIKTHLKRIFQKCEVRSQGELLQILALGPH